MTCCMAALRAMRESFPCGCPQPDTDVDDELGRMAVRPSGLRDLASISTLGAVGAPPREAGRVAGPGGGG